MKTKHILTLISFLLLLLSCSGRKTSSTTTQGKPVEMNYSSLLTLDDFGSYIHAQIKNPWDTTRILHSYILLSKDLDTLPTDLPQGDIIRIPLTQSLVYTSVHSSLIDELGAYDAIRGVCDPEYIYMPKLQSDLKAGKIRDAGNSMNPDIETIIDLSPDAILLSPFQNSGSYGKLGKLGIPIIECADYMEISPLGRAEWMKFYGILYGQRETATTLFAQIENRYNSLKQMADSVTDRPTVFMDLKTGNQWYVPGGNSTIGIMLRDAGTRYIYADRPESGSIPLDPEVVFDDCIEADYWLIKYNQATDKTYDQIAADYPPGTRFSAYRNRKIYSCNLARMHYYEETPFHPDVLLKDYVTIFHPDLMNDYNPRYYRKLQ